MEKVVLVSKKDLEITWFNGGPGDGGSNRNAHNNCCRIYHKDSGISAVSTKERSSSQNQKQAFLNLTKRPEFKLWLSRKILEVQTGKTIEDRVNETMTPKNLKIEIIDKDGQWVEVDPEILL